MSLWKRASALSQLISRTRLLGFVMASLEKAFRKMVRMYSGR